MKELAIFIDNNLKIPVYEQIYNALKKDIINGRLRAGEQLPSTRGLCEFLQCSRSTVLLAYEQLVAEGYIETIPKKGYFVMELYENFKVNEDDCKTKDAGEKTGEYEIDFSPVGIDADSFPFNEWRKISRQVLSSENAELFNSGDSRGDLDLRIEIAGYLKNSRGVKANSERIIIGAGYESLLMILNFILEKNSGFAMENPVYPKAYKLIKALDRRIEPVELDQYGMSVLKLSKTKAKIAYVTPSHQYPTGVIMSAKRRQELLRWAMEEEDRFIIEDDYDSEFRYRGKPIPSLQGLDTGDKVIYIGTFSKSISPAVRMSYMVLPDGLYEKYAKSARFFSNTVSRIDQRIVSVFIKNGGFERHLGRMRTTYKSKHALMINKLKEWENVEVFGENAGAHMLLKINNGMSEEQLVNLAAKEKIKVYSLKDCYIADTKTDGAAIILGYAKLNEETIDKGLSKLGKIWKFK